MLLKSFKLFFETLNALNRQYHDATLVNILLRLIMVHSLGRQHVILFKFGCQMQAKVH